MGATVVIPGEKRAAHTGVAAIEIEKWLDSGYISKAELIKCVDGLGMEFEIKRS